jgi:hypothetical protein
MVLTLCLYVVHGPQEQTASFTSYSVNRLVLYNRGGVFTARYALSPYIKLKHFVFKGLREEQYFGKL